MISTMSVKRTMRCAVLMPDPVQRACLQSSQLWQPRRCSFALFALYRKCSFALLDLHTYVHSHVLSWMLVSLEVQNVSMVRCHHPHARSPDSHRKRWPGRLLLELMGAARMFAVCCSTRSCCQEVKP